MQLVHFLWALYLRALCSMLSHIIDTKWELWQINEALFVTVWGVVGQRLRHVVSFKSSFFHSRLHQFHSLHTGLRVKVAVNANNISSYRGTENKDLW